MNDSKDVILSHPVFKGIKKENTTAMISCLGGYTKNFEKNEIIFITGENVKLVGIVLSGSIHMVKEYENGDMTLLAVIENGELIGETFACGNSISSKVSFQTVTESEILFLPFHKVIHTCNMTCTFHHRLIENMVKLISNKNILLLEKVEAISRKSLREKIMTYLYNQAEKQGTSEFEVPLGRQALSDYLCTNRSALTRELTNMQEKGLITFNKNKFKINKFDL